MTIGDKIRSMNDEELAKLLIRCADNNQRGYTEWDSLSESYVIPVTENLTLEAFGVHDLTKELGTYFFNADGTFPKIDFCSKVGTITITN